MACPDPSISILHTPTGEKTPNANSLSHVFLPLEGKLSQVELVAPLYLRRLEAQVDPIQLTPDDLARREAELLMLFARHDEAKPLLRRAGFGVVEPRLTWFLGGRGLW